mmetsp:Transcript_35813/g.84189  ORF Transcript_35813/g.84189 Transcript_35813/m.84189 type:complete len:173 (+) Transcript_35813:114-632(+)
MNAMSSKNSGITRAFSSPTKYFNPRNCFRRSKSQPVAAPENERKVEVEIETEQYEVKPAWRLLGARKLAREAINDDHEPPLVAKTQSAVLSNRLAWKVLAHRRRERFALAECDKTADDLGCCRSSSSSSLLKKTLQNVGALHSYLKEVEEDCSSVPDALHLDHGSLNQLMRF